MFAGDEPLETPILCVYSGAWASPGNFTQIIYPAGFSAAPRASGGGLGELGLNPQAGPTPPEQRALGQITSLLSSLVFLCCKMDPSLCEAPESLCVQSTAYSARHTAGSVTR